VDVYLLCVGALFLLTLTKATLALGGGEPSEVEATLGRRRRRRPAAAGDELPELARIERELVMGSASAFDFHRRVRPLLREVAEYRLRGRGILVDEQPARARAILGEDVWELVCREREPPDDRHAPGLGLDELESLVDRLERV
jgi:hypothetical protein